MRSRSRSLLKIFVHVRGPRADVFLREMPGRQSAGRYGRASARLWGKSRGIQAPAAASLHSEIKTIFPIHRPSHQLPSALLTPGEKPPETPGYRRSK